MPTRNLIALILTLLSLLILIPGLSQPIMQLNADAMISSQLANFQFEILNRSRSILGTAHDLFETGQSLVAGLIILFCVIVPLLKAVLLLIALFLPHSPRRIKLGKFLAAIGKWSMADVFLVAILLSWLATGNQSNALRQDLSLLGMRIPIESKLDIMTDLGPGFWWFLAYCLLSLAAIQIAKLEYKE